MRQQFAVYKPVLVQPVDYQQRHQQCHQERLQASASSALRQAGREVAQRGFTLLELMVVIVIIAVLAGFVTVNLDLRNTPKTIREEATRLGLLMQIASEQSTYSKAQLGIRFHPEDYEFYFLAPDDKGNPTWQILEDKRLKFRGSQEELEFQVDLSGVPIVLETLEEELASLGEETELKPHVMFLSNGEIMPDFSIVVADGEARYRHQVYTGVELPIVVEQLE